MVTNETKTDQRGRLLEGLAQSLRERGLQATQIADIVRHARTSRRTFYECFTDKESAFVELIRESSIAILELVKAAVDPNAAWDEQVDSAIDAYLDALTEDPALTATVSRELPTLGKRGAALQDEGIDRFAQLVVEMTSGPGMKRSGVQPVTSDAAVMLMGGVAELVVRATNDNRPLSEVGVTAKTIIKAAIEPSRAGAGELGPHRAP